MKIKPVSVLFGTIELSIGPYSITTNLASNLFALSRRSAGLGRSPQRVRDDFHIQVRYHHGKGETIIAKNFHTSIRNPKVIPMDFVAIHESGYAKAT